MGNWREKDNPFRPDVLNRFNDLCFQKTGKDWNNRTLAWSGLTLKAPIPQNGHTHSNNLSASADELFECVWPFCAVGAQRVKANAIHFIVNLCFRGLIAYIWVTSLQNVIYKQHLGLNHLQYATIRNSETPKMLSKCSAVFY